MLVDSHCHLEFPDFAPEQQAVIDRARAAGIVHMLTISTRVRRFDEIVRIAEAHDDISCSLGTHPHSAEEEADVTTEELVALARHPKVVGIGETGLDYYYDNSPRALQQEAFRRHIRAALELDMPVIVHTRDAEADTMRILREEGAGGGLTGLLHCFSSSRQLAEEALDFGFHISFSGIVTFKKSEELRETAKAVPLDRMLVETDAPFLAPMPKRGQRNEPAYVVHTARLLAELHDMEPQALAETTSVNFFRLFRRASAPQMTLRVTILGSGNSTGVPMANGSWGTCDPSEPRNRRRRASILIERGGTTVLVDAGPDLREQMLSAGVTRLDAVVFTHAHADHSQGIDDLRAFAMFGGHPLPIYAFPEVLEQVKSRFHYMFGGARKGYYDKPFLLSAEVTPHLVIGDLNLRLFEQDHIVCRTVGVRVGSFAYSTDVKALSDEAFATLAGVDTWVVAAVRREPHIAHAHLDEVLAWIERVGPDQAFLTHLNQTMDYRTLLRDLPKKIAPAFDGLVIERDD